MTRTTKRTLIAAALVATTGAAGAYASAQQLGLQQAVQKLEAAGYALIDDVDFDDGVWEAEVVRKDGSHGDVAVDPATGEIFDGASNRPLLDAKAVLAKLAGAGYTQIHELEREGALWEAEAWDRNGKRLKVVVSGYDGRVLSSRRDWF